MSPEQEEIEARLLEDIRRTLARYMAGRCNLADYQSVLRRFNHFVLHDSLPDEPASAGERRDERVDRLA